ncbi:GILT-like protein C02D5.2 [Galendromus occidentalis]|uniref:GILT-like protein C02D5.2 n=1 Tax=Galendromus occidentalis TaxID=34638 RepID=A0AAJ6QQH5_9ACAR|nr:GILT-like protein C02D5.2 [Galendromus occidentalis]
MARRNTIILFVATVLISQLLLLFVALHTEFGCSLSGFCAAPGELSHTALADKTKVEVFYETHCPDSQAIMRNGVQKSLPLLDEVDIELVPYGKADTSGQGGSLSFRCQHGQKECDGNMYHACAIDIHDDKKQVLEFAICSMSYRQKVLENIEQCAKQHGIDYAALKGCFSSQKGKDLLAKMGQKTREGAKIINKTDRLDFVPSTIIDGVPRVYESYPDLRRSVCANAKQKPSQC